MPSLLQRLRERNIVQWAVVYLAGAWLFLEALGFVADNFGWPAFVVRSAIVIAAVGFLAVLVLAWYHGERGRRSPLGTPHPARSAFQIGSPKANKLAQPAMTPGRKAAAKR